MNFNDMCRTCLRSGEVMSSIFDEEIEPSKHTAADLLVMFTSVQIDKDDDFPHNICNICLKEIQQAYLFDLKCKKSEIILHQLKEIRVSLKKLNQIPKQQEIVNEDFKLEDIMNLCDRNISDSKCNATERIRSVEEENAKANEKLDFQNVEEGSTRDFQLALKMQPDDSNHFMKDNRNDKELERFKTLPSFQIVAKDCDPEFQITLKHEPDHKRNNTGQYELELNQNSSNFEILDECAPEYEVIFKTEPDQNKLFIKDNENVGELELSEISSNFQIVERVPDFRVNFKTEPELDIGIDCNDEQLQCSACLKQFQSLDMFRGHIVSDHLEENICKLCNEEFECSQFEHTATHFPLHYDEHIEIEHNEKFRHCEKLKRHMKSVHTDEFFSKPDFQCKICSKVFVFRYLLVNHMRTHTGEKPFDCELCPKKFKKNGALLCHIRTQHTDELTSADKPVSNFQCSVCNKVFGLKCRLKYHMRIHTGEKPFNCELCPKKFANSNGLLLHRRTKHTDELTSDDKPVSDFQCSVCYKVFGQKCLLRNHMRTHTGEKPFDCELCPEKFANSGALRCHKRTKHTDEFVSDDKPIPDFQCSICYKVFGEKCILRDHMRVHTGEKPFQCKLCPEKFRKNDALLCHKRTKHTDQFTSDDKPVSDFQCSVCYKVFGHKFRLREHMRTHTGEKPFDCELCPEKFGSSNGLLYHRRTKHTVELISDDKPVSDFQCSVCYKVFCQKFRLREHMRTHTGEKPFDCELCLEKFGSSNGLLSHRRTKHTDELISDDKLGSHFQCSVCYKVFGRKFRFRDHMRTHTGEKPFECELCQEKFGNSSMLLWHRRTKHTKEFISDDKPVPDFQCSVCNKVFGKKYALRDHVRVHTGEKPFQCKLCPETFRNKTGLLCHRRGKHTDEFSDDKSVPDL